MSLAMDLRDFVYFDIWNENAHSLAETHFRSSSYLLRGMYELKYVEADIERGRGRKRERERERR